jgi:mRNA interferase MazF
MVARRKAPSQGDLVMLSFDPRTGHEQKGRRPALVFSNATFNAATGMAIVCPVTTTNRGVPFHVRMPEGAEITGFIMVDQVKSVDHGAHRWQRIGSAGPQVVDEALSILDACLEQEPTQR